MSGHTELMEELDKVHLKGWLESFWIVTKASIPTIGTMIAFQFVALMNIYFIGHTGDASVLAGIGLGNMLLNVCFFALS